MKKLSVPYIHSKTIKDKDSPGVIVPYLINIFKPQSVVDVGCGMGQFLEKFYTSGIVDITGIDGEWVSKKDLYFNHKFFFQHNLETELVFNRKFDLVICLEVAEHLAVTAADILVDNLTSLGDTIIFSAAVPGQGGQNHINEQPFAYWIEKFNAKGYLFKDVFRKEFWNNNLIDWCYRQNMFLITRSSEPISQETTSFQTRDIHEYIHPELLEYLNLKRNKYNKILEGRASLKLYLYLLKKKLIYNIRALF